MSKCVLCGFTWSEGHGSHDCAEFREARHTMLRSRVRVVLATRCPIIENEEMPYQFTEAMDDLAEIMEQENNASKLPLHTRLADERIAELEEENRQLFVNNAFFKSCAKCGTDPKDGDEPYPPKEKEQCG